MKLDEPKGASAAQKSRSRLYQGTVSSQIKAKQGQMIANSAIYEAKRAITRPATRTESITNEFVDENGR